MKYLTQAKYSNSPRWHKTHPASPKLAYFPSHPIKVDKYDTLRKRAKDFDPIVQLRLEWIVFYETIAKSDVSYTALHFGISRKTFHKWYKRFKNSRQKVESLQNISTAPKNTRKWEVTYEQEDRIIELRKKTRMVYGKVKLKFLYEEKYGENI